MPYKYQQRGPIPWWSDTCLALTRRVQDVLGSLQGINDASAAIGSGIRTCYIWQEICLWCIPYMWHHTASESD